MPIRNTYADRQAFKQTHCHTSLRFFVQRHTNVTPNTQTVLWGDVMWYCWLVLTCIGVVCVAGQHICVRMLCACVCACVCATPCVYDSLYLLLLALSLSMCIAYTHASVACVCVPNKNAHCHTVCMYEWWKPKHTSARSCPWKIYHIFVENRISDSFQLEY